MYRRIAQALLGRVYFNVSAVVMVDERGEVISASLLSTDYPGVPLCAAKGAREIWLISNHPEGRQTPYEQDIRNYRVLSSRACGCTVRLFLTSEYFDCFEVKGIGMGEACDIMNETIQ